MPHGHTTLAHTATAANGSGKNKDGGVGAATQAPVLTTPQPSRHPSPTTKATTLGYLIFERPDLDLRKSTDRLRPARRLTGRGPPVPARNRRSAPAMSPYGRNSPASPGSASPSRRLTICENSAAFPAPPRSRTSIGPAGGGVSASPIPPASASTPSGDRPRPSRWRTVPRSRSTPWTASCASTTRSAARRPARGNQAGAHSPRGRRLPGDERLVHAAFRAHPQRHLRPARRISGGDVLPARPRRHAGRPPHHRDGAKRRLPIQPQRLRAGRSRRRRDGTAGDAERRMATFLGHRPSPAGQPDLRLLAGPVGQQA